MAHFHQQMNTDEFIAAIVQNNTPKAIEVVQSRQFNANTGEDATQILLELYTQDELPLLNDMLSQIEFIDRGDHFSDWVKTQAQRTAALNGSPQPRAGWVQVLGTVLGAVGGAISGDLVGEGSEEEPPPEEEKSFFEQYGVWILLGIGALYLLRKS